MNYKLILDTDIGTDVDDAWALALCLASKEIDLLGITLVHADLETRAKITLKMLKQAKREDVPVYKGLSETITPNGKMFWGNFEGEGVDFSDINLDVIKDNAVDYILETIEANPNEIVLCAIGPLSNVAKAIQKSPETMKKLKKLVIMGGVYRGDGKQFADPEHNVCVDPVATKIVLESGIPAVVIGLNVTTQVVIKREDLRDIQHTELGDTLALMTHQYFSLRSRSYTFMHDVLAVHSIIDESVITTEPKSAEVLEDGRIVYSSDGVLDVAVDVDAQKAEETLIARVSELVGAPVA
ncbi:MAG: nucleoside hydrolase [Armatimonadota bacterium]